MFQATVAVAMSADGEQGGLGRRLARGAAWLVGLRLVNRLIGLVSITILARLLSPDDFGIVAIAMTVLGLLEIFGEVGTDAALIRDQNAGRAVYDAAWTINVIRGLVLALLLAVVAEPAAAWFDDARLSEILLVTAIVPLATGLANVAVVDFRKELKFGREFSYQFWSRVVATATTIALALALRSYWALLLGTLTMVLCRLVLSYTMHPFRPRLSVTAFWGIFHYSKWLYLQNISYGLIERLPSLLIARMSDAAQVAFFNVGQEIANLASTELRAPIRRALFPGFAKLAHEPTRLARIYLDALGVTMLIVLPVPLALGFLAPEVIRLLLGPNWSAAVPVAQALSFYAALLMLSTSSHLVFLALGRTHLIFAMSLIRLVALLPLLLLLVPRNGAEGAAWALAASFPLVLVIDYVLIVRTLPISIADIVSRIWRLLLATGLMCLAFVSLGYPSAAADDLGPTVIRLAIGVGAGGASYLFALALLWILARRPDGPEAECLRLCRSRFAS